MASFMFSTLGGVMIWLELGLYGVLGCGLYYHCTVSSTEVELKTKV